MSFRPLPLMLALALPGAVLADARIDYRATEGGGAAMQSFLIGHGKVRTNADDENSVILDPGTDTMVLLDHSERQFIRMGRAELEQMSETIGAAMSQVDAAMASMPPEMRAQMQGMIGDALPAAGGEGMVKVVATGQRDTVAGQSCTIYRTQLRGDTVNETCMGDTDAFAGLSAGDRQTLERALAMTQRLAEALSQGPMAQYIDMSTFQTGMVPLRVTDIDGGTRATSEFSGIDDAALPASVFAVPAGYTEKEIEMPDLSSMGR